jgi:hypothetical protein
MNEDHSLNDAREAAREPRKGSEGFTLGASRLAAAPPRALPASRFALIGAAGYIAPRHMKAIKETDNDLVAALDKSDSVGVIDSYFPDARFFTEFERFDRHIEKQRRENGNKTNHVEVYVPN